MNIETLIPDIYRKIKDNKSNWFDEQLAKTFASDVSRRLQTSFNERKDTPTLRLSQMGLKCPKALWHSIHTPELAEPFSGPAKIKFSYGHIIEAQTIMLAKASGHEVTGEQDELIVDDIVGHRDCVINGNVVDVKSCSTPSFNKIKSGLIAVSDSFGYLDQLDGYVVGSRNDPLVRNKSSGFLLAIDKTLGNMVLYEHQCREHSIRSRIESYKRIIALDSPPACRCRTVSVGKSGNIGLDVTESYSAYKYVCWPHLRTFLYSRKPIFLTEVKRLPDVVEVHRYYEDFDEAD